MPDVIPFIPTKRRCRYKRTGKTYDHPMNVKEAAAIREVYTGGFHDGAVAVSIHIYGSLPKQTPKKVRSEKALFKPDCDNVAKAILDALNGVAYEDDKQVVGLVVIKHDRTRREPYTTFEILDCFEPDDGFKTD